MDELYQKTIQAIIDYDTIPQKQEWNHIAKEHGFLSTFSIQALSGMPFTKFATKIRRENRKSEKRT